MAKKKRGNGEGSVFQRGDGKWMAKITKPRRMERVAKSKQHALILLRQLQEENPEGIATVESITVPDYLARWLVGVRKTRAPKTAENYRGAVKNHISPFFTGLKIHQLTASHIRRWLDEMTSGTATQVVAYRIFKIAIREAVSMGMLQRDPCAGVKAPRHRRKEIRPFSVEECRQILEAVKDHRLEAAFHLGLKCGLRQEELFALQWDDVRGDEIVIRRTVVDVAGRLHHGEPKTAAGNRTIPLDDATVDALVRRKATAMREGHITIPQVFTSEQGKVIRQYNFGGRQWRKILESLDIPHRGFHHCRHTAATLMLSGGTPVTTVAGILGHSTPSVTLNVYAHYIPSEGREAVEKVGVWLASSGQKHA